MVEELDRELRGAGAHDARLDRDRRFEPPEERIVVDPDVDGNLLETGPCDQLQDPADQPDAGILADELDEPLRVERRPVMSGLHAANRLGSDAIEATGRRAQQVEQVARVACAQRPQLAEVDSVLGGELLDVRRDPRLAGRQRRLEEWRGEVYVRLVAKRLEPPPGRVVEPGKRVSEAR